MPTDKNDLHLYVPSTHRGPIWVHYDGTGPVHVVSEEWQDVEVSTDPAAPVTHTAAVAAVLDAFEAYDPTTRVRELVDGLVREGWAVRESRSRDGSQSTKHYLRMVYAGKTGRKVRLYVNTRAVVTGTTWIRGYAATLPFAEVRPDESVAWLHGPGDELLQLAFEAVRALMRRADGEDVQAA